MQQTLISVAPSNGRWKVTESGPRNAVSCFNERQDALEYARQLARRTSGACLLLRKREAGARSRSFARRRAGRRKVATARS